MGLYSIMPPLLHFASLCLAAALSASALQAAPPHTPSEEAATFRFADSRLEAELVAAEPNIVAPVACAWDAAGRLYVVEMTDYPSGPAGGRIRLLEDLDNDGQYERASLFAEGLPFPTGVMPWRNGILVTAAPDIWFLADTNQDRRADVQQKILSGFTEGNQQLRVNGLYFGLDNWIYGANGRSDGEIRWADAPTSAPISIRRHDFRFRPDQRLFEAVAGNSQHGTGYDDWGQRFPVFNNLPVRQVIIEQRYATRAKLRALPDLVPSITAGGTALFPLTEANLLVPQPPGFTTSACGIHAYRSDKLPPEYHNDLFIGEPVQNLLHRRKLFPNGAAASAQRVEIQKEFLASTDPWFHPVYMTTGPDGYLYVVDFYREFVEHPHWVAKDLQTAVNWRNGEAHGRIWRIKQKSDPGQYHRPNLAALASPELVASLQSKNAWERETAHRLLFERQDQAAVAPLRALANRAPQPAALVLALHALDGLNALTPEPLLVALTDQHPRVREAALKLSERFLWSTEPRDQLLRAALRLARDKDPGVQLQLALTLSGVSDPAKFPVLANLADNSQGDPWRELALQIAAHDNPFALVKLLPDEPQFLDLARAIATTIFDQTGFDLAPLLRDLGAMSLAKRLAILGQVADAARSAQKTNSLWNRSLVAKHLQGARLALGSGEPATRRDALLLLAGLGDAEPGDYIERQHPVAVQQTAIRLLQETADEQAATEAFKRWDNISHATRKLLIGAASSSTALASALLANIEQDRISAAEVDATTRANLLRSRNPAVKALAQKLLARPGTDRSAVFESFKPALKLTGSPVEGAKLFARLCTPCHTMQGVGQNVGPELASVSLRAPESLLNDILDPSGQVLPDFINFTLTKKDGETVNGFIAAETADTVTLRRANAPDETIPRANILHLRAEGKSLMPDGLEQGITHTDMANLISFIQRPTRDLLLNALRENPTP